jgi:hypothetical protein
MAESDRTLLAALATTDALAKTLDREGRRCWRGGCSEFVAAYEAWLAYPKGCNGSIRNLE